MLLSFCKYFKMIICLGSKPSTGRSAEQYRRWKFTLKCEIHATLEKMH